MDTVSNFSSFADLWSGFLAPELPFVLRVIAVSDCPLLGSAENESENKSSSDIVLN